MIQTVIDEGITWASANDPKRYLSDARLGNSCKHGTTGWFAVPDGFRTSVGFFFSELRSSKSTTPSV